jgi:hypothetical protein
LIKEIHNSSGRLLRLFFHDPTYTMQILRQKSQPAATPDLYSISDVRVGFDGERVQRASEEEKTELRLRLFVDLEPEVYVRERGFGSSVETKKNCLHAANRNRRA